MLGPMTKKKERGKGGKAKFFLFLHNHPFPRCFFPVTLNSHDSGAKNTSSMFDSFHGGQTNPLITSCKARGK